MPARILRWPVKLHALRVQQAILHQALMQQHVRLVAQALTQYQARALAQHRVQADQFSCLETLALALLVTFTTSIKALVLPVQLAA